MFCHQEVIFFLIFLSNRWYFSQQWVSRGCSPHSIQTDWPLGLLRGSHSLFFLIFFASFLPPFLRLSFFLLLLLLSSLPPFLPSFLPSRRKLCLVFIIDLPILTHLLKNFLTCFMTAHLKNLFTLFLPLISLWYRILVLQIQRALIIMVMFFLCQELIFTPLEMILSHWKCTLYSVTEW